MVLLPAGNPNELSFNITNGSGGAINIDRFFAYWAKSSASQKLDKLFLNSTEIWNKSDPDSPSDIPSEGAWNGTSRIIPDASSGNLVVQFQEPLQLTGYEVHVVFDSGCQVTGSK